jgi:hypothetical protein
MFSSFTFGKNYQKFKTLSTIEKCASRTLDKANPHDMKEFYGHSSIPKPLPHAYAYVKMIWGSCFLDTEL